MFQNIKSLEDVEGLGEKDLYTWLLRRIRGEEISPSLELYSFEDPYDFIVFVHNQTLDEMFRKRLGNAILQALYEVSKGDLGSSFNVKAIFNLAAIVRALRIKEAEPVLLEIAMHGILGNKEGVLDEQAEEVVLGALTLIQTSFVLCKYWIEMWHGNNPRLWPLAIAGLRRSDPDIAINMLQEVILRADGDSSFPLGEVLWAYYSHFGEAQLSKIFCKLSSHNRDLCKMALLAVGANDQEIICMFMVP